ncbi:hypothetical protein OsJ_36141 [Oryza sativa Japonica Group]|uniref:DUF834 domain-containing protein n=2 Tax=Oryza sativa subsp. japonica TaxID=39947 RepID=A0A8J8XSJ2_ORYSJ|nr:hypothetical protein LOC_Os12g30740 [Oryza sativa Japonica Group]EAZ20530.1 hypothetical protein OsJ_36141 [Oryza sativa Japonica Group]
MNSEGDGRRQAPKGGEILVNDDSGVPAIFGEDEMVDGVLLAAANLMEAAATEGDDGSANMFMEYCIGKNKEMEVTKVVF